jgi:(2Fe-2S) ferredoxin
MNEKDFGDSIKVLYVCTSGPSCSRHGQEDQTADPEANPFGGRALHDALKMERTLRGHKREIKVVRTGCQGWCDHSPVATAWPSGAVHHVEVRDSDAFLDAVERQGRDPKREVYDMTLDHAANAAKRQKKP